tara:strand:- start:1985 stop:2764 length:780 start_codon:yes stop_codon:yes gene_type:complete
MKCKLALLLLAITSCQTAPIPSPTPEGPTQEISAQTVMDKLQMRKNTWIDLKSFARASISRRGSTQKLKLLVLIMKGNTIRVDTLSFFGNPLSVFIHDSEKTLIYNPSQNRTYYGLHAWHIVEHLIGSSLDFAETIHLISGNILENLVLESGGLAEDGLHFLLKAKGSKTGDQFLIETDARELVPTRLEKSNEAGLIYSTEWGDYRKVGNRLFAHQVILYRPNREEKLVLTFQKPKINVGLPASAFRIPAESRPTCWSE